MRPLYYLVAQHKQLEKLDVEDVDEATLLATLEGLEGEIALKVESVAAYIRNIECFAEAVEEAAHKMKFRSVNLNAKADRLKAYLQKQMDVLGQKTYQSPEFVIQIKKNPPRLVVDDIDKIPAKFKYETLPETCLHRNDIRAALEKGEVVDGAHMEQGTRLVIRE